MFQILYNEALLYKPAKKDQTLSEADAKSLGVLQSYLDVSSDHENYPRQQFLSSGEEVVSYRFTIFLYI